MPIRPSSSRSDETVQNIARAVQKAFNADGVLIKQFNEAAAGQTIYHLHVHVVPRKEGESLASAWRARWPIRPLLAKHAEMIKRALNSPQG